MSAARIVRTALLQIQCSTDVSQNLERSIAQIREAARAGAQVICLQEVFNTQYPCQTEDHANFELAEPIPGPTTAALQAIAREHQVVIVVPLFERRTHGLYHNSAAVLDADGSIAGLYRKMHIPDDPLYYEKFYFTPGDLGSLPFKPATPKSASAFAGISGTPKLLDSPQCRGPNCCSTQRR
jgi:N-carbamoylputrescine amidase